MLQAILIGLIVFIGKADYFIGTAMFGRPLVLGALVGIVLGDIPTGVMIGFQLELIFMGMQAIGASIPPDMIVGSVLGTAFAITTGKGMETAITIAGGNLVSVCCQSVLWRHYADHGKGGGPLCRGR